jgi:pimeloyl-ACP methyl ester carboxylesterase
MNKQTSQKMYSRTLHRTETVDDLSIFYREAGDSANPKMVLLHGFPASSHQYRNLITALDGMPGYAFGYSDIMSHMGPFVLRTFDFGKGQAAKDRQLAAGSSALAILELDPMNQWIGLKQEWP